MMIPSCDEILKMAGDYDVIPVCSQVYADVVTPIALLRRIAEKSSRFFLLESVEGGEKWGRYSFLGFDPVMRVTLKEGKVSIKSQVKEIASKEISTREPYKVLRDILSRYRAPRIPGQPPFAGGFVGYFGYAMLEYAEPTLHISRGTANDFDLMLFDKVIAYDHLKQKIEIVVNMKTGKGMDSIMGEYGRACMEIENMKALIHDSAPLKKLVSTEKPDFTCNVSKESFCGQIAKARDSVRAGEISQVVISRQFTSPYKGSLLNAYRVLRTTNPSPYMVYMNIDGSEIISTSPETLVRLENGRLTTFPVAGSRPRGATEEEDKRLEEELLADEKELAEHNMLVELGKYEIGRISLPESVKLAEYKMIHRYSKIMHICSRVEGDIRSDCDGCSAVESLLPAGTCSGSPKLKACQMIEELEEVPRGIYGGALGYLDFTGNLDTCIAIRMAVKHNGSVTVQAGCGIVADSVPEKEYEETENKAKAVMLAIENAEEVNDR